jgi:D-tyrosyl-tRNA(Tyr) deacylase
VSVEGKITGQIDRGINLLLGIAQDDTEEDVFYLAKKVVHLRIFEDEEKKMNRSLLDIEGEMLVISQFTLLGDCRKGRRPSFIEAARPEAAIPLYEGFIQLIGSYGVSKVETGIFGADMAVEIVNDGPVTMIIDTKQR